MTQEQFETACGASLLLLRKRLGNDEVKPERVPGNECHPSHLAWMLMQACLFRFEGKAEKAHRWLGFVQGVLAAVGVDVVELKRANMPEGEAFDAGKI